MNDTKICYPRLGGGPAEYLSFCQDNSLFQVSLKDLRVNECRDHRNLQISLKPVFA